MKLFKQIAATAMALGLVVTLGAPAQALKGEAAPAFTLKALNAKQDLALPTAKARHAALIMFWASWCADCRAEAPHVQQLANSLKGQPIDVFGITYKDKPADSLKFLKAKGISYPSGADPDGTLAAKFGVRGTPTIVLVDRKGMIAYQGETLPERKLIDQVLK